MVSNHGDILLQRNGKSMHIAENFGWNQLPCGPVLTPKSCTKLKIQCSAHADSSFVPKINFFFNLCQQVFCWQIKMCDQFILHGSRNSGRDFLVEPAPLWDSSYTHLLHIKLKIHSVHEQSNCS